MRGDRACATSRPAWLRAAGGAALTQPPKHRAVLPAALCNLCQMEAHPLANGVSVCQRCGRKLILAAPPDGSVILAALPDGSEPAIWQCLGCDERTR